MRTNLLRLRLSHKFVGLALLSLAGIWVVFVSVVPHFIEAAYQGRSLEIFNRLISGQEFHAPEHYVHLVQRLLLRLSLYTMILCVVIMLPANIRMSVVSILATVLVLELGFRLYGAYMDRKYPGDRIAYEEKFYQNHPYLGWTMKSHLMTYMVDRKEQLRVPIATNALGLRDTAFAFEKPEDVKRILLLGDSVAVGLRVTQDELIDRQLEHLLANHGTYEVINAGTAGYGTDQSYIYLKEEGQKFKPDVVIYIFVPNDLQNNTTIHRPYAQYGKAYFTIDKDGQLQFNGYPVPEKFSPHDQWLMSDEQTENFYNREYNMKKAELDNGQKYTLIDGIINDLLKFRLVRWVGDNLETIIRKNTLWEHFWIEKGILDPELGTGIVWNEYHARPPAVERFQWDLVQKLIQNMAQSAEAIGARFLVYEFSSNGDEKEPTRLKKVCKEIGVDYHNSFKKFYDISQGQDVLSIPNDGHWNARGHKMAANSIYKYLGERNWIN